MTHPRIYTALPPDVLVTSVHCAICRRFVKTGEYTIAPSASVYAGQPICFECIDMVTPAKYAKPIGPDETKGQRDDWPLPSRTNEQFGEKLITTNVNWETKDDA